MVMFQPIVIIVRDSWCVCKYMNNYTVLHILTAHSFAIFHKVASTASLIDSFWKDTLQYSLLCFANNCIELWVAKELVDLVRLIRV